MSIKSLVTGGAGFIGSHVARHCLNMGHDVVVLDDLSGGFEDHIPAGARFVRGSVTDAALVSRLFDEYKFEYVYHLAAYAAEGLSHFIRSFNYNTNLIGSINLINESVKHKVQCFVFTSSIAVYGHGQLPMTEELTPVPEDPYGISKYAVELDLRAAHHMFGLNYIIFRPHNVYGENQNIGDKYRNVIGIFMNQIMQNQPLTIFGDGEQTRAFSYIDDVAIPIAKSITVSGAYNQVFNIGADKPYTVNELVKVVGNCFNVKPSVKHLSARNEVVHAYSDHAKANKILKYSSGLSLDEGIQRMAEWAKRVGSRQSKEFGNIEISEKLPEGWGIKV
jgi:UDP-glucose 4-epimerase